MSRISLIEFDHAKLPDPVNHQQVLDWAKNMLAYLVGGNVDDLPNGAHLMHIKVGNDARLNDHPKRSRDDVSARIKAYLNKS